MFFEILTLFPNMFEGIFSDSILKRAVEKNLVSFHIDNIRDYAENRYKSVDDYPYGGDPGMLMCPEPVARAIECANKKLHNLDPKVVFMSPHGRLLTHGFVETLAKKEEALIILCGRYKGIDDRIRQRYVDYEISIGDYILSGGEIPAMVLIDSISRLIPGVLGNEESAADDSFFDGLLSAPQFTRPQEFESLKVPEVLLSGHHENIRIWKKKQAEEITRNRRPDLWEQYLKNRQQEINKDENTK